MVRCDELRNDLSALLDGEATAHPRADLESHVAECPACREEHEATRHVRLAVSDLVTPALPPAFTALVVERAMAPPRPGRRLTQWRDRLSGLVDLLGTLLLGSSAPAPASAAGFWRAALGGGAAMAALSVASSFMILDVMVRQVWNEHLMVTSRASWTAAHAVPAWLPLERLPGHWCMTLVCLPLAGILVVALRVLRAKAMWGALQRRGRLPAAPLAAFCGGVMAAILATGMAIMLVTALLSDYGDRMYGLTWILVTSTRGLFLVTCFAALVILLKRGRIGPSTGVAGAGGLSLVGAAAAFYGCLVTAFGANLMVDAGAQWYEGMHETLAEAAVFAAIFPPGQTWPLLAALVAGASLLLGILLAALAWRPAIDGRLRVMLVLLPGLGAALALGAWIMGSQRCAQQLLAVDWNVQCVAARVTQGAGPRETRSTVMLATRADGPTDGLQQTRVPLHVSWAVPAVVAPENHPRLEAQIARQPYGLVTSDLRQIDAAEAFLRWDEPTFLARLQQVAESPSGTPWLTMGVLQHLLGAPPHARYLPWLRAITNPDRFIYPSSRAAHWVARGYARHGDEKTARATSSDYQDNASESDVPVTLRSGVVTGRLLIDGHAAVDVPVRLFSSRERYDDSTHRPAESPADQLIRTAYEKARAEAFLGRGLLETVHDGHLLWQMRCFTATRTDAQGRFHFQGLADGRYLAAALLEGNVSAPGHRLRLEHGGGVFELSLRHPQADLGDVQLRVTGR